MITESDTPAAEHVSDAVRAHAEEDWDLLVALAAEAPLPMPALGGVPNDVMERIGQVVGNRIATRGYRHGEDWWTTDPAPAAAVTS